MTKSKFKELSLKFHSALVIVTMLTLILLLAFQYMLNNQLINFPENLAVIVRNVSVIITTIFIISLILRFTIKKVYNFFDKPEERIFYTKIYRWSLYAIGVFVLLNQLGVSLGNITLFIGLIATGLAFAVRDVLLSFFGWMVLLRKTPFRIGDYIRIGEDEGRVVHIGTFYVLLDKTDELVEVFTRVPNRLFLEKSIINFGKNDFQEQITFRLSGLPGNIKEIEVDIAKEIANLLERKDYIKVFTDIRNEKLCLAIEYLVSFENRQKLRSEVIVLVFSKINDFISFPLN